MIEKIIDSYIKSKQQQQKASEIYLPNNIWKNIIKEKEETLKPFIEKKDSDGLEKLLNNFLQNEKLYRNMFNIPTTYILREYKRWKKLPEANIEEIDEPEIGNPPFCIIGEYASKDNILTLIENIKITSGTLRFQYFASKLAKLLKNIDHPVIMEIGGGCGRQVYYFFKKIKKATYIIFDLPESNILSSFYLYKAFPDKKIVLYDKWEEYDKYAPIADYEIVILPNFELPNMPGKFADLFLNFRSFSEMNMETLEEYFKQIRRILKDNHFFLHENSRGRDEDGKKHYIGYQKEHPEASALEFPIPQEFELIDEKRSPFYDGRYYEYLYQLKKLPAVATLILRNKNGKNQDLSRTPK